MKLIDTMRLIALLLAVVLFFSGIRSALHPKYKAVRNPGTQSASAGEYNFVQVTPSSSSRVFGLARVLTAAVLAGWVVSTFYPGKSKR